MKYKVTKTVAYQRDPVGDLPFDAKIDDTKDERYLLHFSIHKKKVPLHMANNANQRKDHDDELAETVKRSVIRDVLKDEKHEELTLPKDVDVKKVVSDPAEIEYIKHLPWLNIPNTTLVPEILTPHSDRMLDEVFAVMTRSSPTAAGFLPGKRRRKIKVRGPELIKRKRKTGSKDGGLIKVQLSKEEGSRDLIVTNDKSIEEIMSLALNGSVDHQFWLGYNFDIGAEKLPMDTQKAIKWYERAAVQGDDRAQLNLGLLYLSGHRGKIPADIEEALVWLELAAKNGNCEARYHYGAALLSKIATTDEEKDKNEEIAFSEMQASANSGNILAMTNLGTMYLTGKGTKVNRRKGLRWMKKAAEREDLVATFNMAIIYRYGIERSVKPDEMKCSQYTEKSELLRASIPDHGITTEVWDYASAHGVLLMNL